MKKGQMEMIGLVIIVILITLGMLFLAQFAFDDSDTKSVFVRKGLAASTMNSILRLTIEEGTCVSQLGGATQPQLGKDILRDCAQNVDTPHLATYTCSGVSSCEFVDTTITGILGDTLGVWGKQYQFTSSAITFGRVEPIDIVSVSSEQGCPPTKDRDGSGFFPLRLEGRGEVTNILYICD